MDTNVIKAATDSHFTKFSEIIRSELMSKLREHPCVSEYSNEIDRIQGMKNQFSKISEIGG